MGFFHSSDSQTAPLTGQGTGASADRSFCEECEEGFFGSDGVCTLCPNGTQPVLGQNASCVPCAPATAGILGICLPCPDGTQQNVERTACEHLGLSGLQYCIQGGAAGCCCSFMPRSCPIGTAGMGGTCNHCEYPLMQDWIISVHICTELGSKTVF